MTLGQFAYLLNADPKWILNVSAALGGSLRYALPVAKRLAVARELHESLGVSIPRAYELAAGVLRRHDGKRKPVPVVASEGAETGGGAVAVSVDVYRILSAVYAGLSRLRTSYAPRRRGRPATKRRDPVQMAAEYGLDLTLLVANLRRTPAERLRQLDAMIDFRRRVRRESNHTGGSSRLDLRA